MPLQILLHTYYKYHIMDFRVQGVAVTDFLSLPTSFCEGDDSKFCSSTVKIPSCSSIPETFPPFDELHFSPKEHPHFNT